MGTVPRYTSGGTIPQIEDSHKLEWYGKCERYEQHFIQITGPTAFYYFTEYITNERRHRHYTARRSCNEACSWPEIIQLSLRQLR